MVTLAQLKAITSSIGYINERMHLNGCKRDVGPRGGVTVTIKEVRQSGAIKTWKRNPDRWYIPVKYGMFESFRIGTDWGCESPDRFHLETECPIREGNDNE